MCADLTAQLTRAGGGGGRGGGAGFCCGVLGFGKPSGWVSPARERQERIAMKGLGSNRRPPAPESFGVPSGKDMISASLSLWSSTDILQRVRKPGADCGGTTVYV